ncbi:MAG: exodeoxyribonuclease VII small subunit [Bacteroidales bacterium]
MAKEKISYDKAIREIETTLEQIENGTLGVDELAEKVAHVTRLLKLCRERLYQTETRIEKILDEPEENEEPEEKD